ncbi:MAG: 50S ribosomal protein L6 [Niameybacter sp.]
MSRIGNKHIILPEGVVVSIKGNDIDVKGKLGELHLTLPEGIYFEEKDNVIIITRKNDSYKALHGTTRALLNNAVVGVSAGFEKNLEIVGIGYRASMRGANIVLNMGYSHEVVIEPLSGVKIETPDVTKVKISGINKEHVGEIAARIRDVRRPEPYKGKGIKYVGEHIIRKEGKRASAKK